MLRVSPPRHQLYFLLCARAGLRSSEAARVRHEDIAWRNGEPAILHIIGKGNKEALLPLGPSLRALIPQFSAPDRKGWLFPGYRNGRHLTDRVPRYWLGEACLKVGIPREKAHPHALRHSFATHLLRQGVDLIEVRDLMRHSSLAITSIYLHSNPERLQEAVNTIDGGSPPPTTVEPQEPVLRHTEAAVLDTIRVAPGITGNKLAVRLSRPMSAVNGDLRKLISLGHVIADGQPRRLYPAHDDAVALAGSHEVARFSVGPKAMYATVKARRLEASFHH